ncbi:MAG: hypothetical protein ACRELY_28145, partial [Polyangiaceae bacterium]
TGSGGRYCLDASAAGRSAPGTGPGGASCGDGTACRSGLCTNGKCVDTCCSDADCPQGGFACTYQTISGHDGFWCGKPGSDNDPGNSVCDGDSNCHSDFCVDIGDPRGGTCIQPCCTSAGGACGSILGVPLTCIEDGVTTSNDQSLWCAGVSGSGNKAFGTACTSNDDCASDDCDTAGSKKCTDACCTDANCPQGTCRPDANGSLRCVIP